MQKDQPARNCAELSADWLEALEQAKREYQQHAEVAELYRLPRARRIEVIRYRPPSLGHPLTTDEFSGCNR